MQKANSNGDLFEKYVAFLFERMGLTSVNYGDWYDHQTSYGKDILISQFPYCDITGANGKMDYYVLSNKYNLKCRIECKWQKSSGSVDEKLVKLYLDCLQPSSPDNAIIIVDGRGHRRRYLQWLNDAALSKLYTNDSNKHKKIVVMDSVDFINWLDELEQHEDSEIFGSVVCQESIF